MKLDELPKIGSTVKFYTYNSERERETGTGIVIRTFPFDEQKTIIVIKPDDLVLMEFEEIYRSTEELIN